MDKENKSIGMMAGIFLAGFIIGGGIMWLFAGSPDTSESNSKEDDIEDVVHEEVTDTASENGGEVGMHEGEDTMVWNDSIKVSDQSAGMTVSVELTNLDKEGWLVVHELLPDGALGNALGAALMPAGANSGTTVELLRSTISGNRYQVLVYSDDGDRLFDLKKDTRRHDSSGGVIGATFFALSSGIEGLTQ